MSGKEVLSSVYEPEKTFRGYIENTKKTLEIIDPKDAKDIVEKELEQSLSKSNLDFDDKQKIKNITITCLNQLDQNQILSGHIRGIIQGFIPALLEKKPCTASFFDHSAFIKGFEHEPGGISVNDFIFQSLTRKCKPSNFSRLVYRSKYMPTIDGGRILQNRKDGITLGREVGFNTLREIIHDQKNISLLMVSAMIKFYETGDSSDLNEQIYKWNLRYPDDDTKPLSERSLYDKSFKEDNTPLSHKVKTIDILYRLQENLSLTGFEPPETPDQELNSKLKKTSANFNHPSISSIRSYEPALNQLNAILISAIEAKQIGIDPSYIVTTNWIRERLAQLFQASPFEIIENLYTENILKEILKLMELTANYIHYSDNDFENFISSYQSSPSFTEAYHQIFKRLITRQYTTDRYFKDHASSVYKFGGNLTIDELNSIQPINNENIEKQLQSLGCLINHKPATNKGRERYYDLVQY